MVRVHLPLLSLGLLPSQGPSKSLSGVPRVLPSGALPSTSSNAGPSRDVRTLDQMSGLLYD
jgi:hypothetical protein